MDFVCIGCGCSSLGVVKYVNFGVNWFAFLFPILCFISLHITLYKTLTSQKKLFTCPLVDIANPINMKYPRDSKSKSIEVVFGVALDQ